MRTNAHSIDASGYWLSPSPEKWTRVLSRLPAKTVGGLPSIEELPWIARAALCPSRPNRKAGKVLGFSKRCDARSWGRASTDISAA